MYAALNESHSRWRRGRQLPHTETEERPMCANNTNACIIHGRINFWHRVCGIGNTCVLFTASYCLHILNYVRAYVYYDYISITICVCVCAWLAPGPPNYLHLDNVRYER